MNDGLKIVLSLSLSGSLLILLLLYFRPLYRERLSKRWQYFIWLVVVARLLLPFTPQTSLVGALFQQAESGFTVWAQAEAAPKAEAEAVSRVEGALPNGSGRETSGAAVSAAPQAVFYAITQNLWLIWLFGAAVLLIRKITIYQSFVRYVRAGCTEVADPALLDTLANFCGQAGVKRPMELSTNSLIASPLLLGFWKPRIVLPSVELSTDDFAYTVLHELVHLRRQDLLYKWLVQLAVCMHWFNPLVHVMAREISRVCELACDEAVIRTLDAEGRRAYGDTLVNAVSAGGSYRGTLASVTLSESGEHLKERLDAIMKFRRRTRLTVAVSVALGLALCLGATVAGAYSDFRAVSQSAVSPAAGKPGGASYVVDCVSETIVVKQGGTTYKVELDPASHSSYTIRDNTNVPMGERNYRYDKWDIIVERKKELGTSAVFSSTITLTIPNSAGEQALYLAAESGDISAERLENVHLTAESGSGRITVGNTAASLLSVSTDSGDIKLENISAKEGMEAESGSGTVSIALTGSDSRYSVEADTEPGASVVLNGQSYGSGSYSVGSGGGRITLRGGGTFAVSGLHLAGDALVQAESAYWTAAGFSAFLQQQEPEYRKLLEGGEITQSEFDAFLYVGQSTLIQIQNGARIPKSATGDILNAIGEPDADEVRERLIQKDGVFYLLTNGATEGDLPSTNVSGEAISLVLVRKDGYATLSGDADSFVGDIRELCAEMQENGRLTEEEAALLVAAAQLIRPGSGPLSIAADSISGL